MFGIAEMAKLATVSDSNAYIELSFGARTSNSDVRLWEAVNATQTTDMGARRRRAIVLAILRWSTPAPCGCFTSSGKWAQFEAKRQQNRRRIYAIAAVCTPHSHSIVQIHLKSLISHVIMTFRRAKTDYWLVKMLRF